MYNHRIYIVQEFISKNGWRNIRAFTAEHDAVQFMKSLRKEDEPRTYSIEEVPLDVPIHGKI